MDIYASLNNKLRRLWMIIRYLFCMLLVFFGGGITFVNYGAIVYDVKFPDHVNIAEYKIYGGIGISIFFIILAFKILRDN